MRAFNDYMSSAQCGGKTREFSRMSGLCKMSRPGYNSGMGSGIPITDCISHKLRRIRTWEQIKYDLEEGKKCGFFYIPCCRVKFIPTS